MKNMKTPKEDSVVEDVLSEVLTGLNQSPKMLPSKFFYDKRGSELFDEICELEEYYPTRTETKIMQDNIEKIGSLLGEGTLLIELGSGSSTKIRLLLDYIPGLAGYVPVDISEKHLLESTKILNKDYPHIDIYPLVADYTKEFEIPEIKKPFSHKAVYYPGSTIGNFTRGEAKNFLGRIAKLIGSNGGLVIGIDLKKDKQILEKAYNDKKGVTAEFNLNILNHINNEINSEFDPENFEHFAFYNNEAGRIEMHLVSNLDHIVKINGTSIHIGKNEHIITEYSNKYTVQEFEELASENFNLKKVWADENNLFGVMYFKTK